MRRGSKNRIGLLAALLLASLIPAALPGCSLPTSADSTTVTIDEYGSVTETIVESGGSDFTESELKEFIETQVTSFNAARGEDSVTMESCRVSGGSVRIKMKYGSWEFYKDFNNVNCFQGTLRQAEEEGYDLSIPFYDETGAEAPADTLQERRNEWKVIIVEEPLTVKVPDKILYASENVTITGRLSAVVNTVLSDDRTEDDYSKYAQVSDMNAYIIYK